MKKIIAIAVAFLLTGMMIPAAAVYATTPPPANMTSGTLQVEYKFAEGDTPSIPQEIERFGYTYQLVSQTDPVLESTLPATRSYSYRVNGALSQDQLDAIQGMGNINMTPVDVVLEREVDKEIILNGLLTNDVDAIPLTMDFQVTSGTDPSGFETKALDRTGITFDIEEIEDGLPTSFIATVIYRGVESYTELGYYIADSVFTTSDDEDAVDVYVIVAGYETNQMPPPIENQIINYINGGSGETEGLTTIEDGQVALQSGNPIRDIMDGLVPMGGIIVRGFWSLLSMIFSIAGVAVAVVFALGFFIRREREKAREAEGETGAQDGSEKLISIGKRGLILRIMTIGFGIITLLTWLLWDNFANGMVWINEYTVMIGILLAVSAALGVVTKLIGRKKAGGSTDEELNEETA